MPIEISRVGILQSTYTIKDLRLLRYPKFLRIVGYETEGGKRECMHRLSAVVVLPVDWERRIVYMIEQPRANVALTRDIAVVKALDLALKYGASPGTLTVPSSQVHMTEAPAGIIDSGEGPPEAARRELEEETGFMVEESDLSFVSAHFTSVGGSTDRHFCYIANITDRTPRKQPVGDGGERIITHAYTFDEARQLLRSRSIQCSALAVLLREMFLRHYETPPK